MTPPESPPEPRAIERWIVGITISVGILVYVCFDGRFAIPDWGNSFRLDDTQSFTMDFRRESFGKTLYSISIAGDGQATLRRQRVDPGGETAQLALSPQQIQAVAEAVTRHRLSSLSKEYYRLGILDGSQWYLQISQGTGQKSVFFDNNFPSAIRAFAADIQKILKSQGYDKLDWQPVNASNAP